MAAENRDQIQLLYGRLIDVETINPILLSGECICVLDSDTLKPVDFRFGNGILSFTQLPSLADLVSAKFYTKEQADELLSELSEQIRGALEDISSQGERLTSIERLIEGGAGEDNQLASISTVRKIIDERFGRSITFTAGGRSFPSLQDLADGPYFYDTNRVEREQLVNGDLALVDGEEFTYKYNGKAWEPNSSKMVLTSDQEKALNSGVTSQDVQVGRETAEQLSVLSEKVNKFTDTVTLLSQSAAHKITRYKNTVTVDVTGLNYPQYSKCYVEVDGKIINGFILTADSAKGAVYRIYLEDTDFDATTVNAVNVFSNYGDGNCKCKIVSSAVTYDLHDVDSQLKSLLEMYSNGNLSKGPNDGKLRLVRNGQLVPIFVSETTKYVDGSYTGESTGLEFAPFRTGVEALSAIRGTAEPGSVVYAAGVYDEVLDIRSGIAKNISGSAVSRQINTTVRQIQVSGVAERIGFRDLCIADSFKVIGASQLYADNIRVLKDTTVTVSDEASFAHSTFEGTVVVSGGVVEFDACSFSDTSLLEVKEGAKVIVKNCSNVTPRIDAGAVYVHLSGNISPIKGSDSRNALVASDNAAFVGLFDGMSFDEGFGYAPISIGAGVHYAIGSFLCDLENSKLPTAEFRRSYDGLRDSQIVTKARKTDADGYTTDSTYLDAHLTAISKKLKSLADSIVAGAIDKIDLVAGATRGTLAVVAKSQGKEIYRSEDVALPGLGTAAFTDEELYAKATDLERYAPLQTATEQAATISALDSRERSNNDNRVAEIAETNIKLAALREDVLGSTDKAGAIADTAAALRQDIQSAVATAAGRTVYPTSAGTIGGQIDNETYPKQSTVFKSLDQLNAEGTKVYFGAKETTPQQNDKALYWEDGEGEDATYTTQSQAIYTINEGGVGVWSYYASMSVSFTNEQMAAMNSGINQEIVTKIGVTGKEDKTLPEKIEEKQDKLSAQEAGKVVTYSGVAGMEGTPRDVVSSIGVLSYDTESGVYTVDADDEDYEGSETDLPQAKAIYNLAKVFAKYLKQEIEAKIKWPLPVDDGVVAKSGDAYVALTNKQLQDRVKDILKPYYTKEQADDKFTALEAQETKQLLATPDEDSTQPSKVNIFETTISGKETENLSDIPTVGAVAGAVSNINEEVSKRQTKIAALSDADASENKLKVLTRGKADGELGTDLDVATDDYSESVVLAATSYVDKADAGLQDQIDDINDRLFTKVDYDKPLEHSEHLNDVIPTLVMQTVESEDEEGSTERPVLVDCGLKVQDIVALAAEGTVKVVSFGSPSNLTKIANDTIYRLTGGYATTEYSSKVFGTTETPADKNKYSNIVVLAQEYDKEHGEIFYLRHKDTAAVNAALLSTFTGCSLNLDLSHTKTYIPDTGDTLTFYNSTVELLSTEIGSAAINIYSSKAKVNFSHSVTLCVRDSIIDVYSGNITIDTDSYNSVVVLHGDAVLVTVPSSIIVVYAKDYRGNRNTIQSVVAFDALNGKILAAGPKLTVSVNGIAGEADLGLGVNEATITIPDIDDGDVA